MDKKIKKLLREYPTFDPTYMPAADLEITLGKLDDFATVDFFRRGRTGHHVTTEPIKLYPKGHKIAHFDNAADAQFVSALVNAWKAGRLSVTPMEIPNQGASS